MTPLRALWLAAAIVPTCSAPNLAVSTYFQDGFTPAAMINDAQGNVLIAGSAVIDPAAETTGVAVAKLDPKASQRRAGCRRTDLDGEDVRGIEGQRGGHSSHRREKPPLAGTRHANDASQSAPRERSGTVDRDRNGMRMPFFHHHVVTTLHSVESKAQLCPDRIPARDRRVRGHQTSPTRRFSSFSWGAASGILFRFASIDLI